MDKIMDAAKNNRLFVVEDACQATGAEYKKKKAGTFGSFGAFSFDYVGSYNRRRRDAGH
jgi:dTDP-4-amino-4,6-dideoxygalactose transaminase